MRISRDTHCVVDCKELWMAHSAFGTVWTESGEVLWTHDFPDVSFGALWAELAEAFFVVGAGGNFGHWINVKVEAIWGLGAEAVFGVKEALGHFSKIVFM